MITNGSVNSTYKSKWKILDDMTVNILDVADNLQYIRMYYPVDDAMRNRGNLTLISPIFVKWLSLLLSLIHKTLEDYVDENNDLIPSKKDIIKTMKEVLDSQASNHVDDICHTTVTRLPKIKMDMNDRHHLVWDLVDRVLNANIGQMVRLYRQRKLTRVNDVTFCK